MIEDDNLAIKLTDEGKKVADYITEKIMYQIILFLSGLLSDFSLEKI